MKPNKKAQDSVKGFVNKTLTEVGDLPKGHRVSARIDFEIGVVKTEGAGGKIDLKVVSVGGKADTQSINRVRFSVINEAAEKKEMANAKQAMKNIASGFAELAREHPELLQDKRKTRKKGK